MVPVLNFGAEIWGATSFDEAEQLQLQAGKTLLGISRKTTNEAVRGELGWWTMRSQRFKDVGLLGQDHSNGRFALGKNSV